MVCARTIDDKHRLSRGPGRDAKERANRSKTPDTVAKEAWHGSHVLPRVRKFDPFRNSERTRQTNWRQAETPAPAAPEVGPRTEVATRLGFGGRRHTDHPSNSSRRVARVVETRVHRAPSHGQASLPPGQKASSTTQMAGPHSVQAEHFDRRDIAVPRIPCSPRRSSRGLFPTFPRACAAPDRRS